MTEQFQRIRDILKDYVIVLLKSERQEEAQALLKQYNVHLAEDIADFFMGCHTAIKNNQLEELNNLLQQKRIFEKTYNSMKQQIAVLDKKGLPKVSIIIPTHNRKDMLKQAVDGAIMQDYSNLEIIVTDNASNDGTDSMMKNITNTKIKYIRHDENRGATFNFVNAVANIATGKYILTLHDDDCLIDNNYISKAVLLCLANPTVVLVHANCKILNTHTGQIDLTHHTGTRISRGIDYFINYERPGFDHIIGFVTAVCDREKIIDSGFLEIPECYGGDTILYLKLMLAGDVGIIDDYAGLYRYHNDNMSNSLNCLAYDATISELEKLKILALQKGLPQEIMEDWLNFRIWRYISWMVATYFSCGNRESGSKVLNSICEKYPAAYQAVRRSLNI